MINMDFGENFHLYGFGKKRPWVKAGVEVEQFDFMYGNDVCSEAIM